MNVLYRILFNIYILVAATGVLMAFEPSAYTSASVLASGKWVKVSVETDGLYAITAAKLRSWGFSDINRVVIRGYGGHRLADELSEAKYIDDLPAVPAVIDGNSLVFYGLGGGEWKSLSGVRTYYRPNDYSSEGCYFIGELAEGEEPVRPAEIDCSVFPDGTTFAGTFTELVQHEVETTPVPGESGPLLLGESFTHTTTRKFTFDIPDAVGGAEASLRTSFISNINGTGSRLSFAVGSKALPENSSDRVSATSSSGYIRGTETVSTHRFILDETSSPKVEVTMTFKPSGSVSGAWLNYMTLGYTRRLRMPESASLVFTSEEAYHSLEGGAGAVVLDVSSPQDIKLVRAVDLDGNLRWGMPGRQSRTFAVWKNASSLAEPKYAGLVANQNLHADSGFDMVIVSPEEFRSSAERLAAYHRTSPDSLAVKVVSPEEIYNEFSSGVVDPGAFRRYFKMLYDRGLVSARPLRYALLMGRITLDNRGLTSTAPSYPTLPAWMTSSETSSLSDNAGYCTDDITAMLEDGSGVAIGRDKLSIAIGRVPVTDEREAAAVVDKFLEYARNQQRTAWKHRFLFLADDQDGNEHLKQTEDFISNMTDDDCNLLVRKVYMDAYPFVGDCFPEARSAMFRYLEEGVVWWNFIGHANTTGWTHEHQLSYTDLNNMYLRHWPFIYAATCEFLRLDSRSISGGELLFLERYGGAIGIVSAVRPVFIDRNGDLSAAMGRALALRDDSGSIYPPGEVYRRAKNDIRNEKGEMLVDENRLRYTFVGDPALRLVVPGNTVVVDSINGVPADIENQPTMPALGRVDVSGRIVGADRELLSGFNGTLIAEIYDAERTVTTYGNGKHGKETNFEDYGSRIFCGSAKVEGGHFSLSVAMPLEISQNFRPATMSLYAYAADEDVEAAGVNRSFYVYGIDETVPADTVPPVIDSFVLNHEDFRSGDKVNEEPMLIASVSDNVGINVSTAGVGRQIAARLDGKTSLTGLSDYYTPASDGSPAGVLNYPMPALTEGYHTLSLRVWDTSGNAAEKEIDFFVSPGLAPKLYEVYTDANPASTVANFYLRHNRPESMATVTITVYNLLGRALWSKTVTGRSDMFTTVPVTWDLTDNAGRRVGRGIYLYSATITTDGQAFTTNSRRLAVTAR